MTIDRGAATIIDRHRPAIFTAVGREVTQDNLRDKTLDGWLDRVITAPSLDDVFREA